MITNSLKRMLLIDSYCEQIAENRIKGHMAKLIKCDEIPEIFYFNSSTGYATHYSNEATP